MTTLALEKLYTDVVAIFTARIGTANWPGEALEQPFGWRKPTDRSANFRIVWRPGDDEANDDVGELLGPRSSAQTAITRPIAMLGELVTVYIEAYDASAPSDELVQWRAARGRFNNWWAAVYEAAHGNVSVLAARWLHPTNVSAVGATIRVLLQVLSPVDAVPKTAAPPDMTALETGRVASTDDVPVVTVTKNADPEET